MKGRVFVVMKRFVVAALVFTLGLSLTSCGGKKQLLGGEMYTECDQADGLWMFNVELQATGSGNYNLLIEPVEVTADQYTGGPPSGDIAIYGGDGTPDILASQVALIPGRIIRIPITVDQLYYFDTLIIQPHVPGVAFLDVSADETTFCELPQPYDPYYNEQ